MLTKDEITAYNEETAAGKRNIQEQKPMSAYPLSFKEIVSLL